MSDLLLILEGLTPFFVGAALAWLILSVLRLRRRVHVVERGEGLAEWRCPNCGATTRARMADR